MQHVAQPVFKKMASERVYWVEDEMMGGLLWTFAPPNSTYDPDEDIKAAYDRWKASGNEAAARKKREDRMNELQGE